MSSQKVLMLLTRPLNKSPQSGREKINLFIHQSLEDAATVKVVEFYHLFRLKHIPGFISAGIKFLTGFISGKRLPLQVMLFSDKREICRIVKIARHFNPDSIFVESERSFLLLKALRAELPATRIICDFDDLLSRRMQEWASHDNSVSLGYVARFIPTAVQTLISGPLAAWLCRYEAATLSQLEVACFDYADQVILLSSAEEAILKLQLADHQKAKLRVIPPACNIKKTLAPPSQPLRFVFIGSDALLQNRLTIDYLVKQWQTLKPITPLVIYGKMNRQYPAVANLSFAGFADTLDDVYTPNSVLLAPAFVKGGIKTKILESLEYGTMVVGNEISWEGISPTDASEPRELALQNLIQSPRDHFTPFFDESQAAVLHLQVTSTLNQTKQRWLDCLLPN